MIQVYSDCMSIPYIQLLTEPFFADFLDAAERERGTDEWHRLAGFLNDAKNDIRSLWVAMQDDQIIGMVSVRWESDYVGFRHAPLAPEIIDLYVWQAARRQGIATLLMDAAEESLRDHGYQRAGLSVSPDDMVVHNFYQARGYQFDETGYWWNGQNITDASTADPDIAPVLMMMEKDL